jgi:APA family basic amino acid/polyamine antiporter
VFIIAVIAGFLIYGIRESATLNSVLVAIKILAVLMFVVVALRVFNADNFTPFMPYGFAKHGPPGAEVGVMAAAAIIFFAFYGFDAIATAAEETKNPGRDLSIGIVGSMLICVLIYMAVAAAAIGAEPYQRFTQSTEPLALILRDIGQPLVAKILALAASIGMPTVILAFFYGQSRIFLAMSRDGLLPPALARLSGRRNPVRITLFTAVVVALLAGLVPLNDLVALANAGTLTAFKILNASNAYWKGDEKNQPMQRIYGTAFLTDKDLQAHLHRLEEAKKRDHRKIGRDERLFMFHHWAPGAPFWLD